MGTILQWNCRGLANNHPELCILSQSINNPDFENLSRSDVSP